MNNINKSLKTNVIPAVEGYLKWPSDKPQLMGSKCKSCGTYFFPKTFRCSNPDCNEEVEDAILSSRGSLWSYTIQYYAPPPPYHPPDPFVPYGIGLVELPEGIRVIGMLTNCDLDNLKVGMPMELTVEKIYEDEKGNDIITWKFKPATD
ncbi:Zn-ribbon domain-containing OB-fold protein [Thermodesulfobacteriota bacterium]